MITVKISKESETKLQSVCENRVWEFVRQILRIMVRASNNLSVGKFLLLLE